MTTSPRDPRFTSKPSRFKAKPVPDAGAGRTVQVRMGRLVALVTPETALQFAARIVDAAETVRTKERAGERPAAPSRTAPVYTSYSAPLTAVDGTPEDALHNSTPESE